MGIYANFYPYEGTVATTATIPLSPRSDMINITNDSSTKTLQFRFSPSGTWGTLKPTETISTDVKARAVYLSGSSVPYRVWVWA